MIQRKWRIAMDVPLAVRAALLERFAPRFTQFYGWSINWAYGVEETYPYDPEPQICTIYGLHTDVSYQSFAVRIGDQTHQPDGRILHITYTTAEGVMPKHTGAFDIRDVRSFDHPLIFKGRLMRFPLWNRKPTTVAVATP